MPVPTPRDMVAQGRETDMRLTLLERRLASAGIPERLGPNGQEVLDWDDATSVGFYYGTSAANGPVAVDSQAPRWQRWHPSHRAAPLGGAWRHPGHRVRALPQRLVMVVVGRGPERRIPRPVKRPSPVHACLLGYVVRDGHERHDGGLKIRHLAAILRPVVVGGTGVVNDSSKRKRLSRWPNGQLDLADHS